MAKSSSDRNTIDLFGKTRGRPVTQPLSRKDQLKKNKKIQREKDKKQGLKRLEITLDQETVEKLDALCLEQDIKRAEWLTMQIALAFSKQKGSRKKRTLKE
ncbi:LexA regulated protein [Marinomonas algicola]|uniref:LexA regulated protein n=1 Tax=Marinomonas algicola TaxID=2773454 RepID=UPI00174A0C09|nr:LexA regulated protein [Marinomonas algicola]